MRVKKLEVALEKTEALLLPERKEVSRLTLEVTDNETTTSAEIKYLGVTFDSGDTMRKLLNTCKIAEASAMSLSR